MAKKKSEAEAQTLTTSDVATVAASDLVANEQAKADTYRKLVLRHRDHGTGDLMACESDTCELAGCAEAERGTVIGHLELK